MIAGGDAGTRPCQALGTVTCRRVVEAEYGKLDMIYTRSSRVGASK